MKGKSPVVNMAHSIGNFFGMSGLAVNVQGKYIGFIRDRGNSLYPVPFLHPPQNVWAWAKVKYLDDTVAFEEHFDGAAVWDKLWTTGAAETALKKNLLPHLLPLPTSVVEFMNSQGGVCLHHKLCSFVQNHINNGETQIQRHKWNPILNWCIAASQEKNKVSLLNIGTTNPALCQDQEFLNWCNQRIQITLGEEPRLPGEPEGGTRDLHLAEQTSNNMGWSFLARVQALAPTIAGAARQGGYAKEGGNNVECKLYSENYVAALKGYCGVVNPHGIPAIWDAFQQTKELAQHRHNLRVGMMTWSKQTGMDIDKAPYFT